MNPRSVITIVKKELRSYFDNPSAYIILIVFLLLWEFLFFRNVFLIGEASLRNLLSYIPWLFIILVPALTMGSISGEKGTGTLEFLLTHPLKIIELVLGKFIAATLFVSVALSFMFPIAITLGQFGDIDWGVVVGQFLASVMMSAVFVSLGIFVSSFFSSQIASLLVAATASFFLVIIGFELITVSVPTWLSSIFERISILSRFESMSRGVIDVRDLWYLLSSVAIFLSLAFLQLLKLRMGNQKRAYRQYVLGIGLFIGISFLVNVVGSRLPGRIDLTEEKIYQLTNTTKHTLESLDDVVNINLFASSELPAQLRPILRDTKDMLRDYQLFGNGKVQVSIKDPSNDPQAKAEAGSVGVQEVQFNVIGQEELQLKKGYLGLAVSYGAKNETIPIISDTSDLEYQLTSFIKKLTTTDKKTVSFVSGHGQKDQSEYTTWVRELSKQYQVTTLDFAKKDEEIVIPETTNTLVIPGPRSQMPESDRKKIAEFFNKGGSVLLLLDGANVNSTTLTASVNNDSLADFIESFGLSLGQDIVYDLRSNETVNFGSGGGVNFIVPYPFWPRVIAADKTSPMTSRLNSMVLTWPSSVTINDTKVQELGYEVKKLFVTTPYAGAQVGSFNLTPDQQIVPTDLSQKTVAVSIMGKALSDGKVPRMVVVGDSDFLTEQIAPNTPENIGFGIEAVAWLTQEQSLAEIQLKQTKKRNLIFQDQNQITLVKYGNLGIAFLLPFVIGATRIIKRRNLRQQSYS